MITKGVTNEWAIQALIAGTFHQHLRYIIIGDPPSKLSTLYEIVTDFRKMMRWNNLMLSLLSLLPDKPILHAAKILRLSTKNSLWGGQQGVWTV